MCDFIKTNGNCLDNFRTIVVGCCDLVSLARSLRLDTLWDANQNPSLRYSLKGFYKWYKN